MSEPLISPAEALEMIRRLAALTEGAIERGEPFVETEFGEFRYTEDSRNPDDTADQQSYVTHVPTGLRWTILDLGTLASSGEI